MATDTQTPSITKGRSRRARQLRKLIQEQARDARTDRLPENRREQRATDLGLDLDTGQPTRNPGLVRVRVSGQDKKKRLVVGDMPVVYLAGLNAWTMAEHALAYSGIEPCPVCQGAALPETRYCLGCDAAGFDGRSRAALPGQPITEPSDDDPYVEPSTRPKYRPKIGLRGGK